MNRSVRQLFLKLKRLLQDKKVQDFLFRMIIFTVMVGVVIVGLRRLVPQKVRGLDMMKNLSSFHDGSSGTMALKEFLLAMEFPVERFMEPLINLVEDKVTDATILMIEPLQIATEKEVIRLEKIISSGNTVILVTANPSLLKFFVHHDFSINLLEKIRLIDKKEEDAGIIQTLEEEEQLIYQSAFADRDVSTLYLEDKKCFSDLPEEWKSIVSIEEGPLVIEKPINQGRLVLFCDSSLVTNYRIREKDNSYFIYRLLDYYHQLNNRNAFYIDEFHHGYHRKYTLFYFLAKKEYQLMILQIFILFIIIFYTSNIRFGQYEKNRKTKDQLRIYYYTEGMSGLLAKRKYVPELYTKFLNNVQKLSSLNSYRLTKVKQEELEVIKKELNGKKPRLKTLKKMIDILKKK
ncbi:MAG: DUF4350 domain-containing protein [Spirochaetes bacterium]|nr:DUF4350 domain-containing protein [Spirochaetota bacterium]